jgi:hypothetical protein
MVHLVLCGSGACRDLRTRHRRMILPPNDFALSLTCGASMVDVFARCWLIR